MSEDIVIDAFGARWSLDLGDLDAATRDRLATLWSRAMTNRRDGVAPFVVTNDPERAAGRASVRIADDPTAQPYTVSRAITLASIARRAGHDLMFHAAGLASADGRAAALIAGSGTGKTTAALTLGRHLGYLSDETVAIADDGTVAAYAKPLSVLPDPEHPFDKTEHSPDELELLVAPDRPRLAVVVLLDRDPAAGAPQLTRLGLVDALLEVIPQTSSLARLDRPLQRLASALTLGGGPWRMRYAEIADCLDIVRDLVAGAGPERDPPPWTFVDPPTGPALWAPHDGPVGPGTRVVRAPWRDAVQSGEEVLVMRDTVPLRLAGIGAAIWATVAAPVPVRDLVGEVVRRHGRHPDAGRLVTEAATALIEGGALLAVGDR